MLGLLQRVLVALEALYVCEIWLTFNRILYLYNQNFYFRVLDWQRDGYWRDKFARFNNVTLVVRNIYFCLAKRTLIKW